MALPLPATLTSKETPLARAVRLRATISHPPAVVSDSHLGGFARGHRLSYLDMMQFVWWASDELLGVGASFSNAFSSAFEGGVGSPTGSGFGSAFSGAFR